jgi:hypothetical protein
VRTPHWLQTTPTWHASGATPYRPGLQTAIQGWSGDGRIHFNSRPGPGTTFGAYSALPDGSDLRAWLELPGQHVGLGNTTADGHHAIASISRPGAAGASAEPGRGVNNDLWLIRDDGQSWQLTFGKDSGLALIWPMLNHDGSKVCFATCYYPAGLNVFEALGYWKLMTAKINYDSHMLTGLSDVTPVPKKFYETYGWDAKGRLLFASDVNKLWVLASQIWVMNEDKSGLTQVSAPASSAYCEFSQQLPDGAYVYCTGNKAANKGMDHWVRPAGPAGTAYKLTSQSAVQPAHPMATSFAIEPGGKRMVATYIADASSEDLVATMFTLTKK